MTGKVLFGSSRKQNTREPYMPQNGTTEDEWQIPLLGGARADRPWGGLWLDKNETHPGVPVKASQAFTPSDGGDFQQRNTMRSLHGARIFFLLCLILFVAFLVFLNRRHRS